jgi:predicted nucleic acid-binding protein
LSFVLDPSVAAKWFLRDERSDDADAILSRMATGEDGHAPTLFRWELQNLLLTAERSGRIIADDVDDALTALRDMPLTLHADGNRVFAGSEMHFARAYDLSAYDGAYLALTTYLSIELVTADEPLERAARSLGLKTTFVT